MVLGMMGNCISPRKPNSKSIPEGDADKQSKVVQIVKTDGKIIELKSPTTVKSLLVNFAGFGIAISQKASQYLPPTYELKIGKIYYLIPSPNSTGFKSGGIGTEKKSGGVKRIKVVITKQQLQELLAKQKSIEDVLFGLHKNRVCSVDSCSSTKRNTRLESIPEEIE